MSVFLLCSHSDISSARWSPIFQGSSFSLDIVSDRYKLLKPYNRVSGSMTCDDRIIIFDLDALSFTPDKPKFDCEQQVALINELSSSGVSHTSHNE